MRTHDAQAISTNVSVVVTKRREITRFLGEEDVLFCCNLVTCAVTNKKKREPESRSTVAPLYDATDAAGGGD